MARKKKKKLRCPECGSTMEAMDGFILCTQDMLNSAYPLMFREIDCMSKEKREAALRGHTKIINLMYDRWTHRDPKTKERTQFCCQYDPNKTFNPMGDNNIRIADPAQVLIAEKILGRKLTEDEYFGDVEIPLINMQGRQYMGIVYDCYYPRDFYPKFKDMIDKTNYSKMPKLFDFDELGKKGRE
jgi:hypothetical protein